MDKISIHALLAESDAPPYNLMIHHEKFLSTLSLRRATDVNNPILLITSISIHALLAESDNAMQIVVVVAHISIHALLAESDPLTGRTKTIATISIHALLAESDFGGGE